jgi:nitroreductase
METQQRVPAGAVASDFGGRANAVDLSVQAVESAILSRRSVRHFLPTPVPKEMILRLLDVAARAPSGNNSQPWHVHVVTGKELRRLSAEILMEFNDPEKAKENVAVFNSYPTEWRSPYNDRRKKIGIDMYRILGIAKGDAEGMHRQAARNFTFFDAPVGLIFALDRAFVPSSAIDLGMFMGNVMTAARARGLDTCPQAALGIYHRVVTRVLGIGDQHVVMCGMALGYADHGAAIDALRTEREPAERFSTFHE